MMIKTLLAFAIIAFLPHLSFADKIYKHTDEYGNVTYSDEPPHASAEKIELKPINTTPPIEIKPSAAPSKAPQEEAPPAELYNLRIASPKAEQQYGPREKILTVVMLTDRQLDDEHFFQVFLNGEAHESTTKSNNVNIPLNLTMRGTHNLYAAIVDSAGTHIEQSPPVTFFVIRPNNRPRATPY